MIHDWYWRMLLEQALTDTWLGKGDLKQAGAEAERFVAATLTTAERTWQALAWEASARVAMAEGDRGHARTCVDKAVAAMEGFEVPLAAWRVHASAAELESRLGNQRAAERHRSLARSRSPWQIPGGLRTSPESLPRGPSCERSGSWSGTRECASAKREALSTERWRSG